MGFIVSIVPRALTIDLDAVDINGNEFVQIKDISDILSKNNGYIDGDRRQIVIWCK